MLLIKDLTQIKGKKVRLVCANENTILDKMDALQRAANDGMDLVLVQDGEIPVVKLCDYAKIEYEKQKSIKHNHPKKAKTIAIGPHTQGHDLARFATQATEFIKEGHSVTVRMQVRGRDRVFKDLIRQKLVDFVAMVTNARPGRMSESHDGSSSTYTQVLA